MKTILSIFEAVMFNLLPPALAGPVVTIVKDFIPLLGIAFIRMGLYLSIFLQKLYNGIINKIDHSVEEGNLHQSLRY